MGRRGRTSQWDRTRPVIRCRIDSKPMPHDSAACRPDSHAAAFSAHPLSKLPPGQSEIGTAAPRHSPFHTPSVASRRSMPLGHLFFTGASRALSPGIPLERRSDASAPRSITTDLRRSNSQTCPGRCYLPIRPLRSAHDRMFLSTRQPVEARQRLPPPHAHAAQAIAARFGSPPMIR